mmetsp:Transcript_81172/g.206268  ORF Transcript_81172/g.206268 Transcript_81172/m.206268 type:complete len:170 (-) Transcript_81172:62-571(-)
MDRVPQKLNDQAAAPQSDDKPSNTNFLPPIRRKHKPIACVFESSASTCMPDPANGCEDLDTDEVEIDHGDCPEDDGARRRLPMTTADEMDFDCAYDVFDGGLDEDSALHARLHGLQRHPGNPGSVPGARSEGFLGIVSGRSGHTGAILMEDAFETPKDICQKQGRYMKT